MKEHNKKKNFGITAIVLGILALALLITVLAKNCAAVKRLGADYHRIRETEYRSGDSAVGDPAAYGSEPVLDRNGGASAEKTQGVIARVKAFNPRFCPTDPACLEPGRHP